MASTVEIVIEVRGGVVTAVHTNLMGLPIRTVVVDYDDIAQGDPEPEHTQLDLLYPIY